jgi:hypothetical protein
MKLPAITQSLKCTSDSLSLALPPLLHVFAPFQHPTSFLQVAAWNMYPLITQYALVLISHDEISIFRQLSHTHGARTTQCSSFGSTSPWHGTIDASFRLFTEKFGLSLGRSLVGGTVSKDMKDMRIEN